MINSRDRMQERLRLLYPIFSVFCTFRRGRKRFVWKSFLFDDTMCEKRTKV